MTYIKVGTVWLVSFIFFIALSFGISNYESNSTKLYIDRRISEQQSHTDGKAMELRREYTDITAEQQKTNRYLIYITCMTTQPIDECKEQDKELGEILSNQPLPNQ
ncbi:MAG: hypothetical protein ACRESJ_14570 [Pseudomonas sp.]|uniref:hypothetical protein n=1 Tax=Pseudomonas sp. TaxID=306 RepID=UPI003D6E5F76